MEVQYEAATLHLRVKVDNTSEASSSADWGSPLTRTNTHAHTQRDATWEMPDEATKHRHRVDNFCTGMSLNANQEWKEC